MNPFPNQETAENQQERPQFLQYNSAMHVHDNRPYLAEWRDIMFVSGTFEPLIVV